MASFINVAHKKLTKQQIDGIINVYNERLQNELTRDAALKAITKISLNSASADNTII